MTSPRPAAARKWLILVILLAVSAIAGCALGVRSFFDEDRNPVQRFGVTEPLPATRLEVDATVQAIDAVRGFMKVELDFRARGELAEANGRTLARDVHLLTDSAQGARELLLKKHHPAHAAELTLSLLDGDVALYPIDRYNALLQLEAYVDLGGEDEAPVPLVVNFVARNHALHAEAAQAPGDGPGRLDLQIRLQRPTAVQGFAWFMNSLMVLIALSAAIVVYNVAWRGKKPEPGLMIWISALLFVLPTIRNMLPGAPPLGSLTDFLVFFWVEGVIAVCLFIMVLFWYRKAVAD